MGMDTKGRLVAGSHNRNEFGLINVDEFGRVTSVKELTSQICQICGDEIEFTVNGEPFVLVMNVHSLFVDPAMNMREGKAIKLVSVQNPIQAHRGTSEITIPSELDPLAVNSEIPLITYADKHALIKEAYAISNSIDLVF
ncbi:hypothetical protein BUALT_Bualt12G0082100 [Buddleja alternifolia]|uniref:Cellulose synthase RING-type zinc finger domain-containing protein n=1 Tax=Buddleja alternifolia TaxID=168488 RepID=A0AAV6WPT9_9LAMI|nr:hypothetical protein BUALT_Bualt12G0082100 [Buddleja alternifolia]